jgi:hypothetical protein
MSSRFFLASNTLTEHLLRGVVGISSLIAAIHVADAHPLLAFALGVITLIAFRGCPLCWTAGLIETVRQRFRMK